VRGLLFGVGKEGHGKIGHGSRVLREYCSEGVGGVLFFGALPLMAATNRSRTFLARRFVMTKGVRTGARKFLDLSPMLPPYSIFLYIKCRTLNRSG